MWWTNELPMEYGTDVATGIKNHLKDMVEILTNDKIT